MFLSDILPPVITNCTGVVYGFADRGGTTGRLNWPEPSVHDNADSKIKLQQNTGPNRSARLRSGTYDVIYDAEDSAGNKALRCKMKAVMKGMFLCRQLRKFSSHDRYVMETPL